MREDDTEMEVDVLPINNPEMEEDVLPVNNPKMDVDYSDDDYIPITGSENRLDARKNKDMDFSDLMEQSKIETYPESFSTLANENPLLNLLNNYWCKTGDIGLLLILEVIIISCLSDKKWIQFFSVLFPFFWYRYFPFWKDFFLESSATHFEN